MSHVGGLFAGYDGIGLALEQLWPGQTELAWYSEIEPAACTVLAAHHPGVPNLGDVTAVDWTQVEPVDVLTGGFPCQDVSSAGLRAGVKRGTRSGLWFHMAEAIDVLRPRLVVIENVLGLLSANAVKDEHATAGDMGCGYCDVEEHDGPALRALGAVLGDLAEIGYDASWTTVRAADAGAPHGRARVFIAAYPDSQGLEGAEPAGGRELPARGATADTRRGPLPRAGAAGHGLPVAAERGDGTAADADRDGHGRELHARGMGGVEGEAAGGAPERQRARRKPDAGGDLAAADPDLSGRDGRAPDAGRESQPRAASARSGAVDWGKYGPAIRRWEAILGRPAPAPTVPGRNGRPRLNPALVEWMMGLPDGHVTGHGLSAAQELKMLGNGVVPQQAALALRMLGVAA